MTEHESPTPGLFFIGSFEIFETTFFCVKISLATIKIWHIVLYTYLVKGNDSFSERTGTIVLVIIKLS